MEKVNKQLIGGEENMILYCDGLLPNCKQRADEKVPINVVKCKQN